MRRVLCLVAATIVAVAAAPVARANGRFPATTSISFRKGTPHQLLLASTIGVLLSQDDGKSFYWICDQAVFGDNNNTYDPDYQVATDGTIYANTNAGLRVSRDGGCTWEIAQVEPGLPSQKWVDAEALGPNDELWLTQAEGGMPNDVFESTDGGHTFQSKGLSSQTIWWKSVQVAASDANVVYVSGYEVTQTAPDGGLIAPQVHVLRSDDGGGKWTELPTTDFAFSTSPLVLVMAVSPTDPQTVFAISQAADPPMGDKLYRSTNGGANWTLVLDTTAPVRDVVFLQDGSVLVGTPMGAWQAPTPTGTFAPVANPLQLACVGQREDGSIFGCGANWDPDNMALGKTGPATVGPWSKVFRFVEMKGPLSCPSGTIQHDTCELQLWPSVKEQFGIMDPDGAPMPDAQAPPPKTATGCCESGGASGLETAVIVVLAVVIGGWLVRRGRRKKRCCQ